MPELIEPHEITVTLQSGAESTFVLSKFPAIAGREIVLGYPVSNMPKVGEYRAAEELMLKLLSFVGVKTDSGQVLALTTRALVDNHLSDWETLVQVEWKQLEYNVSFFKGGLSSDFFANLKAKAPAWISQILTALSVQSSPADKPPSTN